MIEIEVDGRTFERALAQYERRSGRTTAQAINRQFPKLHWIAKREMVRAARSQIRALKSSRIAVYIAINRLVRRGERPSPDAVKAYIERMIKAKLSAVGFSARLIQAAAIASKGGTPQVPRGVQSRARRASEAYQNAWVHIQFRYKSGDRRVVGDMILDAYDKSYPAFLRDMSLYLTGQQRRLLRSVGL